LKSSTKKTSFAAWTFKFLKGFPFIFYCSFKKFLTSAGFFLSTVFYKRIFKKTVMSTKGQKRKIEEVFSSSLECLKRFFCRAVKNLNKRINQPFLISYWLDRYASRLTKIGRGSALKMQKKYSSVKEIPE